MRSEAASSASILRRLRTDLVVEMWQPHLVSRSSRYILTRHAAMFRRRYESVLDRPAGSSAAESARRARILHVLGREEEARRCFDAARRLDPDCAEAWAWRWCSDFAAARGPRSFEGVDRAVALEPGRAAWTALRGVGRTVDFLEGRSGALRNAMPDLERALDLDSSCLTALIAAGMALSKAGEHHRALGFFGRALRADPGPSFLHAFSGDSRFSLGDVKGFVADCERAVYADEGLGYFQRAIALDSAGRSSADWIEAATGYLARNPRAHWMYVYRGDCRRAPEINDFLGGLRDLEKAVELRPDCAYAWAYLARARLAQGGAVGALEAADRSVRLNPSCGWISIWRGELRRRLGDAKDALADFDRGLKLDPDYDLGYAWRGGAKRLLGRPEEALDDLALAGALDPRHAWAIQEHSLALRQLGRTGEALVKLEAAHRLDPKFSWCAKPAQFATAEAELNAELRRNPRSARAWAWRGEAKLRNADFIGAKADLDRALALDRGLGWAWAWRGRARQELRDMRAALKDFDEALRLEPLDAHAHAYRGRLRFLMGDSKAALGDLRRAVELNRKSSWIYLWAGEAAESLGLFDEAGADFDLSLGIDRRHVAAMIARGALRRRLGDEAGAREDLGRAYAAAPAAAARLFLKREPGAAADSLKESLTQAQRFAEAGRHADAAAVCGEILRVEPDDEQALRLRAEAYRCAGEYEKLVADLDRLARLAPERPDSWVNRGMGRRNAWDFKGALDDAEKALRLRPEDPSQAMLLKSEALRNLGRFPEAVAAATSAIETRESLGWAYVVRGKARRQSGDVGGALADFRRASRLDARDAKARGWGAEALRKEGRLKEAASAVRKAVALQPACAWAVALSGEIDRELGRRRAGLERLQRAVGLDANGSCAHDFLGADPPSVWADPAFAWVYAWRGGILRKKEDWTAARRDLEHAVELDPECFWARAWLGELKLAVGDAGGALDEFAGVLHRHKDYADVWTWQGRAYGRQGRWRPALSSFQKALSLDANDPWALIGCSTSLANLGRRGAAENFLGRARKIAPGLFEAKDAASC